MEDLFEELKNLIPTVIIISSFLLPAFLKKKKDDKKKKKKTMLGTGPAEKTAEQSLTELDDKARAEKDLEDQIRKYFTETQDQKAAQATKPAAPKPAAPKPAVSIEPPAPTAEIEPLAPSAPTISPAPYPRPAEAARIDPTPARRRKPLEKLKPLKKGELVSSLETAPLEDAYVTDTDAYKEYEDAYAIERDVHESSIKLGDVTEDLRALSTLKKAKKPLPGIREKTRIPRRKKEEPRAAFGDWEEMPPLTEMNPGDLRRAIILKEVLGRPVCLKEPGEDFLW